MSVLTTLGGKEVTPEDERKWRAERARLAKEKAEQEARGNVLYEQWVKGNYGKRRKK